MIKIDKIDTYGWGKTCKECEHWTATHSSWGKCDIALNGEWFTNHTKLKPQGYRARHTNSREKGNKACVVRFKEKQEVKENYGKITG